MNNNRINYLNSKNPDQFVNDFKDSIYTTSECNKNILNDDVFGSFLPPEQIIDWMEISIKSE